MDPDADAIFASDLQDVNKKFSKKGYITVEISVPDPNPNLDPHVIGLPDPDPSISKQK